MGPVSGIKWGIFHNNKDAFVHVEARLGLAQFRQSLDVVYLLCGRRRILAGICSKFDGISPLSSHLHLTFSCTGAIPAVGSPCNFQVSRVELRSGGHRTSYEKQYLENWPRRHQLKNPVGRKHNRDGDFGGIRLNHAFLFEIHPLSE